MKIVPFFILSACLLPLCTEFCLLFVSGAHLDSFRATLVFVCRLAGVASSAQGSRWCGDQTWTFYIYVLCISYNLKNRVFNSLEFS